MWLLIPVLLTIHIIICLLLVAAVLMQLPRSEGLGAAFGGGMTENLFGAQTTHVLTKFTVWLGVGFFVVTLALAIAYSHLEPTGSQFEKELLQGQKPVEEAHPQPTATPASASQQPSDADVTSLASPPETADPQLGESAPPSEGAAVEPSPAPENP